MLYTTQTPASTRDGIAEASQCPQLTTGLVAPLGDSVSWHMGFMVHLLRMPLNPSCSFHQAISPKPRYFPTWKHTLMLTRISIKSSRSLPTGPQGIAMLLFISPRVVVYLLCAPGDESTLPLLPFFPHALLCSLCQAKPGRKTSTGWCTRTTSAWSWRRSSTTAATSPSAARLSWLLPWGSPSGRSVLQHPK